MFKKSIPINIAGGSYESKSRPLSSQKTMNFYPQIEEGGKDQFVLYSFPGLKPIGEGDGADRGMFAVDDIGYRVSGNKLYKITPDGYHEPLMSIAGEGQCTFATDGLNLIICNGSTVYKWDGTGSTVTDSNIINAEDVTYLNNQAIYIKDGFFVVSDAGSLDTASGLNIAGAESNSDSLIRAYAFKQTLYLFGKQTIEPWWNTGNGLPPFERMDGQIIQVGLGAKHSIAHTDNYMYWLGDDLAVYRASGGNTQKISSNPISEEMQSYLNTSNAVGYTFNIGKDNYYAISFPSANKTWCMSENLADKGWFQLSSGTESGIYQGSGSMIIAGRTLMGDRGNGNLYKLDVATYTNNGDTIQRQRVTSSVNSELFGVKGQRVQMSRLEIIMEVGVGLLTGQGENPQVIMETSYDGGRSWKHHGFIQVGRLGEYVHRVEFFNLDSFYDCMFRITCTDPVPCNIYSGAIDLRLAGW